MEALTYKEWRNQNSESTFPFIYENMEIDNTIFVDASIVLFGSRKIWLSELSIKDEYIHGELKTDKSNIFTFTSKEDSTPNKLIKILNNDGRACGSIMLGSYFSRARKSLSMEFNEGDILLNPTCIISLSESQVSSIRIDNNILKGFINFHEGPGIKINGNKNLIVFDSVGKDISLISEKCCEDGQIILKKINNISPTDINLLIKQKDIGQPSNTLDKRQVLRINPIDNGIKIELTK
jgi:hypothetical protein